VIPLHDVNTPPARSFPFINTTLILINIAVFVYEFSQPAQASACFTYAYSFDPAVLTGHVTVPAAYAATGCIATQYHLIPAWQTIFTSMFLHSGLLHIGGNMLFLYVFGDNVEDRLGHIGYLIFYLICGVVASLAQTAVLVVTTPPDNLDIPNLGASGAIAGVLGAYLIFFPRARVRTLVFLGIIFFFTTLSAVIVIGVWFLLQVFDGWMVLNTSGASVDTGVAYFAHIGGFLTGLLIAIAVNILWPRKPGFYTGRIVI
jgi:membrane associated rhomboid family serine protease